MALQQNTATAKQTLPVIARSNATKQSRNNADKIELPRSLSVARNDKNVEPDRHTPLLKWANELGKCHISENKRARQKQWTPEKRARQATTINDNKPWLKSTGAKQRRENIIPLKTL